MTPKELRKRLKLNVQEMGDQLGCSPSTVSMIENEERNPSYELIKNYAITANGRKVTFADFTVKTN